jgi:NADH-quinone oxidoreductase subunit C
VTEIPSEAAATELTATAEAAAGFAALVGSEEWTADHGTAVVKVPSERWVEAHQAVQQRLPFFSFLSAVDWSKDVAVGEPPADDDLEERYQVISRISAVDGPDALILSTEIPKADPWLPSITGVYPGADWHERETAEMFGIRFEGHPNPVKLYLPDGFQGHPLRKDFGLASREVKPWPGAVDVEAMPSTENPEAPEEGGA